MWSYLGMAYKSPYYTCIIYPYTVMLQYYNEQTLGLTDTVTSLQGMASQQPQVAPVLMLWGLL